MEPPHQSHRDDRVRDQLPHLRSVLFASGFVAALAVAVAVVAYNMYGGLTLTPIPPGRMSVFSYIGLKDLQRGSMTAEALKAPAMLAYLLGSLGLGEFTATKGAALLWLAGLPFAGGLFGYAVTKSKLVGGAAAILLSFVPLGYVPATGGDYTFVSALVLVQFYALFAFLLLRSGRLWLVPVWFGLSVAAAVLIGLDVQSASWLVFITGICWGAYAGLSRRWVRSALVGATGTAALAVNAISGPDPTEVLRTVSLDPTLSQYQLLLVILGVAGLAGGAALAYRQRLEAVPVVAYIASGLVLLPFFGAEALFLVFPGVVLLSMVPLDARGMLRSVAETAGSGQQVVVEVQFEKLIAFAFALMVISSPLVTGFGPGTAVQGSNYLGNEELQTINQVKGLDPSIFGSGLVAAPSSIAPWLRADLGVNTLPALNPNDSAVADALTSTAFRLRSPFLQADEWTPLSSVRSPVIYAYDGATYGAILHLDDGLNQLNVTLAGKTGVEDMNGMYMSGYGFTQNATAQILTVQLTSLGFNVTKQLVMSKVEPVLGVSYQVTPNVGTPVSMTLPVFLEGTPITSEANGDALRLVMSDANVTLTFPGGTTPQLVRGATEDHVWSSFNATSGTIRAGVVVDVQSAKDSGLGSSYTSLLDLLKEGGVSSLLTLTPQRGLNFLAQSVTSPYNMIDSKDTFNRVLLNLNGADFVEAPAYARVVSQSISNSSCDASVQYATAGLSIDKRIASSGDSLTLSYAIQPTKAGATLESMNMTFWVPLQRTVLGQTMGNGSVTLRLDTGDVTLSPASGQVKEVMAGVDPVYSQYRVTFEFALNPQSGDVGVSLQFGSAPSCQNILTTRPVMTGADELDLYTTAGVFQRVYTGEFFTVYDVVPGELPP